VPRNQFVFNDVITHQVVDPFPNDVLGEDWQQG
jgi:hypothetical protein